MFVWNTSIFGTFCEITKAREPSRENHAWAGPSSVGRYMRTAFSFAPPETALVISASRIAIRSSPRSATQSSLPFRLKVGSCGSRPTRTPLVSKSLLVLADARGFG